MEPDVVDLPDAEAVRHFRSKRDRRDWDWSFDWRDVSAEEHLVEFTFAKAAKLDVLRAVRAEVDRAIAEGRTLRQFVGDLKPRLQKLGWWGEKEMTDPRTGQTRLVEIGPRRLATIFDTNLRMAHAKGRWERIERLADRMPYLRYVATLDARTRPDHRRWHGVVLLADDPWWRSHFPPNGWRCRCQAVQLSERALERAGWTPGEAPPVRTRRWTNKRTGEVRDVPEGIDPGFDHNPGMASRVAAARQVLAGKIAAAQPAIRAAAAKTILETPADYAAEGRRVRESIGVPAATRPADFRAALLRRLRDERGAGGAAAAVNPATGGGASKAAADLVRDASRLLPRAWVEASNAAAALFARRVRGNGGGYYDAARRRVTLLGAGAGIDVALHEYVHHLQATLPGFQRVWRAEHLRRTTRPDGTRDPLGSHVWGRGRDDDYAEGLAYMGRDYRGATGIAAPDDGDALEVATMAHQATLALGHGRERLGELAQRDPGMLDLLLGMLFRFDP